MKRAYFAGALGASCIAAALIACGDDADVDPFAVDGGGTDATKPDASVDRPDTSIADAGPQPVTLKFKAKVGAEDFKCGTTYTNLGSTSDSVAPRDLRFFVQDVMLLDATGRETPLTLDARSPWQTKDVALLDFEDGTGLCANGNPELNDIVTGTVPAGTYSGLRFTNGVPAASITPIPPRRARRSRRAA